MQADGGKSSRELAEKLEMSKARSQLCVLRKSHLGQAEHSHQVEDLEKRLELEEAGNQGYRNQGPSKSSLATCDPRVFQHVHGPGQEKCSEQIKRGRAWFTRFKAEDPTPPCYFFEVPSLRLQELLQANTTAKLAEEDARDGG